MVNVLRFSLICAALLLLVGCASQNKSYNSISWQQAMHQVMQRYQTSSQDKLMPYFKAANVQFPPKALTFMIFKQSHRFEVYAKDKHNHWRYIRSFPILAASGGYGPKLREGDHQVPEGIYQLIGMNPESRFDLSLHLNYPNAFDKKEAYLNHRHDLGSDIFIHGRNRSIGCIAIGDNAIQQIFPLVDEVGLAHVKVIIAPDDFRYKKPIYGRVRPKWLPTLYWKIKKALVQYPVPA